MLEPADEHWHVPTTHAHWNESFYLNFFDADSGWACAARVGATPNRGEQDGFICLYLPDNTTGFIRVSEPLDSDRSRVGAGGIEFRCIEPLRCWHLTYDGPIHHFADPATNDDIRRTLDSSAPTRHLQLDLTLASLHPPFDYDKRTIGLRPLGELYRSATSGHPLRTARNAFRSLVALPVMVGAHHYEQSGTIQGTVTVDGQAHSVRGVGQRDHSWGVRDMRAPANWRWLSCQFDDALCFNATQVDLLGMRVQGGFVLNDGVAEAIASWSFEASHGASRFWPDTLDIALTAQSGSRFAIEAEVLTPLPVMVSTNGDETLVTAARAKFRWGGLTTDGMVEFMEQLP